MINENIPAVVLAWSLIFLESSFTFAAILNSELDVSLS